MKVLRFSTPYRPYSKVYTVYPDGCITSENWRKPSGQWKLVGIRHVRKTSLFIPLERLLTGDWSFLQDGRWRFKTSGNPQWTVEDLDHGTRRRWGRGIHSMWFEEV